MTQPTPISPDDIPAEITRMTYQSTQAFSEAGLPVLSQTQTAVLLAHYWSAIAQHVGAQVRAAAFAEAAEAVENASLARLDAIDEDDLCPSDQDQHQEWCDAATLVRGLAAVPNAAGGE